MSSLSVRIPDELFKKLNKLAKKTRRTKSSFIKQLIEENIEDLEYAYIALERMNDKKTKYLSTDEVEKQLEL